jgi:hypothetical protein
MHMTLEATTVDRISPGDHLAHREGVLWLVESSSGNEHRITLTLKREGDDGEFIYDTVERPHSGLVYRATLAEV